MMTDNEDNANLSGDCLSEINGNILSKTIITVYEWPNLLMFSWLINMFSFLPGAQEYLTVP